MIGAQSSAPKWALTPHQLVVIDALRAEAQHEVVGPGLLYRLHGLGRELPRKIHAIDIGAERRAGRPHLDPLPFQNCCHGSTLSNQIAC